MNLAAELAAMTENVRQQAPAELFHALQTGIRNLLAAGLENNATKKGNHIRDFALPDATGKLVRSADLRQQGLLLISFYRGVWCPYCNLELKALQGQLGEITAAGASLLAISPQTPDMSLTTQEKHALKFPVLSDVGNRVARQFGLVYSLDANLRSTFKSLGIDLQAHNGDDSFELPVPATYLIGQDGTVLDYFASADWTERLEPEEALRWIRDAQARRSRANG